MLMLIINKDGEWINMEYNSLDLKPALSKGTAS